jgi:hypothetical protein
MKILDAKKVERVKELLEDAQSIINDAVSLDDEDIGKSVDIYRTIGDVIDDIENYLQ